MGRIVLLVLVLAGCRNARERADWELGVFFRREQSVQAMREIKCPACGAEILEFPRSRKDNTLELETVDEDPAEPPE